MAKLSEKSLINFAMAYFYAAIRAFRARMAEVETMLQRFHTLLGELNTLWTAFDDAYKRSTKSLLTEEIARLDTERDHYAAVVKETAKLWANHFKDVDETLAIRGRRVLQPFIDFDFSTHESMVAENSKIENIEQVLGTATASPRCSCAPRWSATTATRCPSSRSGRTSFSPMKKPSSSTAF